MANTLLEPLLNGEKPRRVRTRKTGASAAEIAGVLPANPRATTSGTPDAQTEARIKKDFRLFVILLWRHLGLPDPTPLQLSIAWYLQHGPKRSVIKAFRGAAKSWITAAYVLWLLYSDNQLKVLVVSASLARAVSFTQFCLNLLREWPLIQHLHPEMDQKQSSQALDVAGARPDASANSIMAKGINGQITGGRADVIVADDVEVQTNSLTVIMREKISEAVKEFDSVLKPGGAIRYLGTDHDQDSLYVKLEPRGYSTRIWPAVYPSSEELKRYGDKIAPYILDGLRKDSSLVGHSTEPSRFTDEDLEQRKLSLGSTEFALQFLLDTSFSDRNKYPLKLRELMVMPLDNRLGPDTVTWGMGETKRHLPTLGFNGDYWHAPAHFSDTSSPYTRIVATTDISGRGSNETCMIIGAELHGLLFLLHCYASLDGYSEETLKEMALLCVRFGVHQFYYESNFGDGMFGALFAVALKKAWDGANEKRKPSDYGGTEMVELKTSNRMSKEKRIVGVLEPVVESHRIVVSEGMIQGDFESLALREGEETRHKYSLWWQYTHLTREPGAIPLDDRIDALGMFVGVFADAMGLDPEVMAQVASKEKHADELERMLEEEDELAFRKAHGGWHSKDRTRASLPSQR